LLFRHLRAARDEVDAAVIYEPHSPIFRSKQS